MVGGAEKLCRIYDNEAATCDRYTCVYTGRYRHRTAGEFMYVGMSANPFHPQGFGQHGYANRQIDCTAGSGAPSVGRKCHLGRRIRFADLPKDCKKLVVRDLISIWKPVTKNYAKIIKTT